jgi:hypothetical protein
MFIVQDPRVIGLISNDFDGLRYNTLQERIVAVQGTSTASMDSVSLEGEDCKLVSSDRTLTDAATGNIRNVRMRVWLIQRDSRLLFRRSETEYSTTDSGGVPQNSRYQIDVDHAKHELTDIWVPTKYVIEKRAGGVDNYRETALINVIRLNNGFDGDPFSLKSMEHLKPGAHGLSSKGWIEWDGARPGRCSEGEVVARMGMACRCRFADDCMVAPSQGLAAGGSAVMTPMNAVR